MSSPVEVQPNVAAKIAAQGQARGLTVDDYLRSLLKQEETTIKTATTMTPQDRARALREWAASHNPDTPLLSNDAIRRETIYGERG